MLWSSAGSSSPSRKVSGWTGVGVGPPLPKQPEYSSPLESAEHWEVKEHQLWAQAWDILQWFPAFNN